MIETIRFKDRLYPALQSKGNAMQYAIPFAKKVLKNCSKIYDIGCNREEWKYPGAIPIDPIIDSRYDAMNFPKTSISPDAIISSHCLEHLNDWVGVLNYWHSQLGKNGIMFLYLPHTDQQYWRPWHNRKHINAFMPSLIKGYLHESELWTNIFVTDGYDLNHSFYAIAQKK